MTTPAATQTYQAFISYSHADTRYAAWLQSALESFRVPRHLVGRSTDKGEVKSRIGKIFRDRSDLSLAADLGTQLREELAHSKHLIVICSPDAARSRWVNEEILEFKKIHGESRILALIVRGKPFASEGSDGSSEALPPALRFQVDPQGHLTNTPSEPLAADIQRHADGKRLALLKLIASLLSLPLDELIQRDHQRRLRLQRIISTVSVIAMLVLSTLTYMAISARELAEQRRLAAEDLVNFMLTDLRDKLEPIGRLDVLDVVADKVLDFYGGQDRSQLPDDALSRQATAMHLLGEMRDLAGKATEASRLFEQAAATTAEILRRKPDDINAIFNHSQSLFWVGYPFYQAGNYSDAKQWFQQYTNLAQQLVRREPDNEDWKLEYFYALSNLAIVEFKTGGFEKSLELFNHITPILDEFEQQTPDIKEAIINNYSWLGSVSLAAGHFQQALNYRMQALTAIDSWLTEDSERHNIQDLALTAHHEIALIYSYLGQNRQRDQHLDAGLALAQILANQDPTNTEYQFRTLHLALLDLIERPCVTDCTAKIRRWKERTQVLADNNPTNFSYRKLNLLGSIRIAGLYGGITEQQQVAEDIMRWQNTDQATINATESASLYVAAAAIQAGVNPEKSLINKALALLEATPNWFGFESVCDAMTLMTQSGHSTQPIERRLREIQYVKPCA